MENDKITLTKSYKLTEPVINYASYKEPTGLLSLDPQSITLVSLNNLSLSIQKNNNYQWAFVATQEYINNKGYFNKFVIFQDKDGKYMIQCNAGQEESYLAIDTTNNKDYQYAFFATQTYLNNNLHYSNKFSIVQDEDETFIVFDNNGTYLYLAYDFYNNYEWNWVIFANENYFKRNKNYATQFIKKLQT